jgi:hypothetical protein
MNGKTINLSILIMTGILLFSGTQIYSQFSLLKIDSGKKITKLAEPRLYTERSVYQYNETVVARGEGFTPFEPVTMTVRRIDSAAIFAAENDLLTEWIVFTDQTGALTTDWIIISEGSRFLLEATGGDSNTTAGIDFIVLNHTANLDQCRNGTFEAPSPCTGPGWVNGDLSGSQAHYVEGESVPYRLILQNLDPSLPHSVTIEYDTTESAKHALDYLTTFNRTETDAEPCSGIAGCDPAVFDTIAIPLDQGVANGHDELPGTADDITPAPGAFTLYGGTITGVSAYTMTGNFAGSSQTRITINFTAAAANPVLAWGGHIATRQDWGVNHSAIAINGAPYHMRLYDVDNEGGGNQDRSMQSSAVIYPGRIAITKDAQPDTTMLFGFTATGPAVSNFVLDDNGDNTDTYANTKEFVNLTNFGATHSVTVTESSTTGPYFLSNIVCTSEPNGGAGSNNNTISVQNRQVEIVLEEGEDAACTFYNAVPTAAAASVSGRVTDAAGNALAGVRLTLVRPSTGEIVALKTNNFGRYLFTDLAAGENYVIRIAAKRYVFNPNEVIVTLSDNIDDLDFQAVP